MDERPEATPFAPPKQESATASGSVRGGRPHVLLADDDALLRAIVSAFLRTRGYDVSIAVDGEEALSRARTASPDVILLDMLMPKLDGMQVLRALKSDPAVAAIPVFVLSGLSADEDVASALQTGAAGYVRKGTTAVALVDAIVGAIASVRA